MSRTLTSLPEISRDSPASDAEVIEDWISGKWRILKRIGVGGTASVYEAVHHNGHRVAIKISRKGIDPEMVARFVMEGRTANRIDHPNVVRVLDEGMTDRGVPYLVMELLHGETLAERLNRQGPVGVDEALRIAHQILDVLEVAHAAGIVHRDIKPDNVMITRDGTVKLLDFGIARDTMRLTQTVDGSVMGTFDYMPSEQAMGDRKTTGPRTDLWSVGALLFTALTNTPPRQRAGFKGNFLEVAARRLPPVQTMAPQIPAPLARALDHALAHDVTDRVATARAMQQELRNALLPSRTLVLSGPPLNGPAQPKSFLPPSPSRKAWVPPVPSIKPLFALGLVVLGIDVLLLWISMALTHESILPPPRELVPIATLETVTVSPRTTTATVGSSSTEILPLEAQEPPRSEVVPPLPTASSGTVPKKISPSDLLKNRF